MEMLENFINKYHNQILTAAEVIEKLVKISKNIQQMDKEPKAMDYLILNIPSIWQLPTIKTPKRKWRRINKKCFCFLL